MLAVGVEDEDQSAGRLSNAGLHRGPIAFVVRMTDDARARASRSWPRVIRRAVVNDQSLVPVAGVTESRNQRFYRRAFVECRDDDRNALRHVANRKLMMSPSSTM